MSSVPPPPPPPPPLRSVGREIYERGRIESCRDRKMEWRGGGGGGREETTETGFLVVSDHLRVRVDVPGHVRKFADLIRR